MLCGRCGKENENDLGFCVHCGAALTAQRAGAAGADLSMGEMPTAAEDGDSIGAMPTAALTVEAAPTIDGALTVVPEVGTGVSLRGRYRVLRELGRGGMGVVSLAEDGNMAEGSPRRRVAVKLLPAALSTDARWAEQMRREFDSAARLASPHVVRMWDFDRDEEIGAHFLVMEYVEGPSLDRVLREEKRLSPDETLELAAALAEALAEAQEQEVLHRDVKPANVMVPLDGGLGKAKLGDFGVARVVRSGLERSGGQAQSGTLMYNSPEQFRGGPMSGRSDIYSLGAVLWECLAGRPLVDPRGDLARQVIEGPAPRIEDAPGWLNELVLRCLAKSPDQRFAGAGELLGAVLSRRRSGGVRPAAVRRAGTGSWTIYEDWPFDAAEARRRQEETAAALGVPIERSLDAGGVVLEMVLVPAGDFVMGSPDAEQRRDDDEGPMHRVRISRPFYVGKHPVTQEVWERVRGESPAEFRNGRNPVETVSWYDCGDFLKGLNALPGCDLGFRLPTEAEWEYACRAGTATAFNFGETASRSQANYDGEATTPVGSYQPNAWGLFDCHGNVWEWCADRYDEDYYRTSPGEDPTGPEKGSGRVMRGGSWRHFPGGCRSALRLKHDPGVRGGYIGLRVVAAV